MMPSLTTPVNVPQLQFQLDFTSGIVSLGSCFADEMGTRLQEGGFHIEQNPFGTLYNPASIASALHRIIDDREITAADLVEHEGLWHSWHHHGSFSRPTQEATLEACNARIHQAHNTLKEANLLMITFGTAWVFELRAESGEQRAEFLGATAITPNSELQTPNSVVANCHKLPASMFTRRRMTVEEIVSLWTPLIEKLNTQYPALNIVFTVSPIRHMADGAHGNQLSKSTLLLAIDQLRTPNSELRALNYFPAYEIVLDELRDYRFFGPDMTHPTALAVDVVWERFQCATMTPAVREHAHLNAKQLKREKHIPLHDRII